MRDQQAGAEARAVGARRDRERDTTEIGVILERLAAQGQRHEAGARRNHAMTELPRERVAEAGRAHLRNRQAAAGDDQRCSLVDAARRRDFKDTAAMLHIPYRAVGFDGDTGLRALVEQHAHDQLRGLVAEQLAEFLFVVRDAVTLDHRDEIPWRVARQCGFAEMRIGREKILGRRVHIGEIAAAAARHQNFPGNPIRVFDDTDSPATLPGDQRAHETGRAAADDDDLVAHHTLRSGNSPPNSAGVRSRQVPTFNLPSLMLMMRTRCSRCTSLS